MRSFLQKLGIGRGRKEASELLVLPNRQSRPRDAQGAFSGAFNTFVARKVSGDFYELMREAVPYLDGGINRLVSLMGHIKIVGNNRELVERIKEWAFNVPIDDGTPGVTHQGLQALLQIMMNEAFEQGFVVAEWVANKERNDIRAIYVNDSKTIKFKREKTNDLSIHQRVDSDQGDGKLLKPGNLMYFALNPEAGNPYGTSVMRSCEIVSKTHATIMNTIGLTTARWGDPSFLVKYKAAVAKSEGDLKKIRDDLTTDFNNFMAAKKAGNAADFISATSTTGDLTISVIGQDGQVLDLEIPIKFVAENLLAKMGLAPWMVGIFSGTVQGLADAQVGVLMADILTRQGLISPMVYRLIRTWLTLQGITYKPGDWGIEWEQVQLNNIYQVAQAEFLRAQARMMDPTSAPKPDDSGDPADPAADKSLIVRSSKSACSCGHKHVAGTKEQGRAIAWPEMDKVSLDYETAVKSAWGDLADKVLAILRLEQPKSAALDAQKADGDPPLPPDPVAPFEYSDEQKRMVDKAFKDFVQVLNPEDPNSPLRLAYGRAYSAGLLKAAALLEKGAPITSVITNANTLRRLQSDGFELVKENATSIKRDQIIAEMELQVMAGTNPLHVARKLRQKFGAANSQWERLTRSEMALASERAKLDEWKANGVDTSKATMPVKDTHPHCYCTNSVYKDPDTGEYSSVFIPAPGACPQCEALAG